MDGISSASAVVSLTVQLISTTRDIIKFLQEIQESPEAIRSTIEFLEQFWRNLEVIKGFVEEESSSIDPPSSIASISNTLRICESKIKLLEQCVNKSKGVLGHQSHARKTWASLKYVLKKGEMQKLQNQLDQAASSLELALITNVFTKVNKLTIGNNNQVGDAALKRMLAMSTLMSITQEASTTSSRGNQEKNLGSRSTLPRSVDATRVGFATTVDPANRIPMSKDQNVGLPSAMSSQQPRVVSKETMFVWYTGILGNLSLQTKSKVINGTLNVHILHKRSVYEERVIVIRPSFTNNQFELRFVNRCGHISRTLSTDCVVDFKAPVFDMCRSGDITGLRDAFNSGSASIHVVNQFGMGLLHYAAGGFQKEICSWLLKMNVDADRTSIMGKKALTHMGMKSKFNQTGAVTETMMEIARLLAQAQKDLSAFDISMWFRQYKGPPEGAKLILSQDLARYYISSADDDDPLYPALAAILCLYAKNPGPWDSVLRTLIRYGADVHAPVLRDLNFLDQSEHLCPVGKFGTPLDDLFTYTLDPFEGQVAANGWLQILESEGFNVFAYLETESALHARPMQLTYPSFRTMGYESERKLVFDLETRPTVSWDWWINPSSSTFLLREEFRVMAITPPDGLLIARPWEEAWPIRHPEWSELHQFYGNAKSRRHYKDLLNLANKRAARREEKKARKTVRAQKSEWFFMVPGAWPMTECF